MMRRAILSTLVAALFVSVCAAQAVPQGPGAPIAPADVDPAKMAAPNPSDVKIPGAAPVDAKKYILGAEDMIAVLVWRNADFSGPHLIRPDGKITVNMLGDVTAAGITPEELAATIRERLKKYIVEPDVTVSVTGVNSKRYFIQGEVNKPGEFKLVVPTKVLEALVNAGGFRDFANQKDIRIMRGHGSQRLKFNYKDVIKGKHLDENIYLEQGDIIIVR
jgi:polysaccharide biosynthesis/export protein